MTGTRTAPLISRDETGTVQGPSLAHPLPPPCHSDRLVTSLSVVGEEAGGGQVGGAGDAITLMKAEDGAVLIM